MGDTDILCVHHEFKAENKILTIICKVQNSLELVSWRIFLFFFLFLHDSQAHEVPSALFF